MTQTAADVVIEGYLEDVRQTFEAYKRLADRALVQVSDKEFFARSGEESNSIALIVKHIAGNQRSRWRNFLDEDGEKPDRHRDTEFELFGESRPELIAFWEEGWSILFDAIGALRPSDLSRTVSIRGEPHTVVQAINRQLTHYSYHIGQIVLLAKGARGADWRTLSVPKNRSADFNRFIQERMKDGTGKSHPLDGPGEFAESDADRGSKP